jgi:hypothetical protein
MVAEEAKELLPPRYPFVYEFELAIQMDPLNAPLRRELGFLLLKMNREKEAVAVFEALLKLGHHPLIPIGRHFPIADRVGQPCGKPTIARRRVLHHHVEQMPISLALRIDPQTAHDRWRNFHADFSIDAFN